MVAKLLDGKRVATERQRILKNQIAEHIARGFRPPGLAVILIGDHPASQIYVAHKSKACQRVGVLSRIHHLPKETQLHTLLDLISELNNDPTIDGILIQLPLPSHLDANNILETIDPKKDVDGFHPYNLGRLAQRR